jgi:hypothetical protein
MTAWRSALTVLMAAFVSITQAAFYAEGRHRWQLEPMLLLFAATGFLRLTGRITDRFRISDT